MKTLIQILFLALLVSCNSNENKALTIENAENKTIPAKKKVEKESKIDLPLKGDYTSLFNAKNCSNAVNKTTVAEIVQTEVEKSGTDRVCRFVFQKDEIEMYITVSVVDMSNHNIPKEIENYMTNPPFLMHEISKTGDSHICRQDSHKRLIIYNTHYTSGVMITYGVHESGQPLTKEQKSTLKDLAVNLANSLLIQHQN